jgi:hypothetical protein
MKKRKYFGKTFRVYDNVTDDWIEEAITTAKLRRQFHAEFGSQRHWYDPKKGEYTDEIYGSLGQIVFREKIREVGLGDRSEFCPLYTEDLSKLPDWDAKVCGKTIEVKGIPPDDEVARRRLLVKKSEFKCLDIYAAVKFWNKRQYSFCGFATGNEVAKAPVADFGFAPAHWIFLNELRHRFADFK